MTLRTGTLFVLLMLFGLSANADMTVKAPDGDSVTLHEEQCATSPWLTEWKSATMIYQGKQYAACWRLQISSERVPVVVVLDSGGDVTTLPMQVFKPVSAI